MLKWRKDLRVGEGIKNSVSIISRVNAGKKTPGIYLITMPVNPANVMEIISADMLQQNRKYTECPEILGIASGFENAAELVGEMVSESYGRTGSVRNF